MLMIEVNNGMGDRKVFQYAGKGSWEEFRKAETVL